MRIQAFLFSVAALVLTLAVSAPAFAEQVFTVHLGNGNEFSTIRQPRLASWDENTVLVLTDAGNWIGIPKGEIEQISNSLEVTGFGRRIDDHTVAIGFLANDAPVEGEPGENGEPATEGAAINQILERYNAFMDDLEEQTFNSSGGENYTTEQFVEPGSSSGVPLGVYDDY